MEQTDIRTRIGYWRAQRGMTQREAWEAAGLTRSTYKALERGDMQHPPLRVLVNLALVFDVAFEELLEDDWKRWTVFDAAAPGPPDRACQTRWSTRDT